MEMRALNWRRADAKRASLTQTRARPRRRRAFTPLRGFVKTCLLAGALALAATQLPGQQDSVRQVRALIERETAPLDVKLGGLRALLRPDSGTTRADSSFEKWKASYDTLVYFADRHLQTEMVQFLVDPGGATPQRIRRDRGDSSESGRAGDRRTADSLRALLERHGVHGHDEEGDMYYSTSAASLRRIARPFLTEPLQKLVDLWALEERAPSGGDGGVGVSWDELARRLAISDGLLTDHPTLVFAEDLRNEFVAYLGALLGDWPNSSGFSYERPHVFHNDARARVERYVAQHPDTRGGRIASDYIGVLRANNWQRTQAVEDFLNSLARRAESPRFH
jgi:hypothetical protein